MEGVTYLPTGSGLGTSWTGPPAGSAPRRRSARTGAVCMGAGSIAAHAGRRQRPPAPEVAARSPPPWGPRANATPTGTDVVLMRSVRHVTPGARTGRLVRAGGGSVAAWRT